MVASSQTNQELSEQFQQFMDEMDVLLQQPLDDLTLALIGDRLSTLQGWIVQDPTIMGNNAQRFAGLMMKFTISAMVYSFNDLGKEGVSQQISQTFQHFFDLKIEAGKSMLAGEYQQTLDLLDECGRQVVLFNNLVFELLGDVQDKDQVVAAFDVLIAQNNLHIAQIYQLLGDYQKAIDLLESARVVFEKANRQNNIDYVKLLSDIGMIYYQIGSFSLSQSYMEKAIESSLDLCRSYIRQSLSDINQTLGDEEIEEKAIQMWSSDTDIAVLRNNLGLVYGSIGNIDAEAAVLLAVAQSYEAGEIRNLEYAKVLNNLGVVLIQKGEEELAGEMFLAAIQTYQALEETEHPDAAQCYANASEILRRKGDYENAAEFMRYSISIENQRFGENQPNLAIHALSAARIMAGDNQVDLAFTFLQDAQALVNKNLGNVFSFASETQRLNFALSTRLYLISQISLILNAMKDDSRAIAEGLDLVLRRKGLVTAAIAAQHEAVLAGRYPDLADEFEDWRVLRNQIAQKTLSGPGEEGIQAYQSLLAEMIQRRDQLEGQLAKHMPDLKLEDIWVNADRQKVALALPGGSLLIEIVKSEIFNYHARASLGEAEWLPSRYLAFVMPAGEPDNVRLIDLGEAGIIDQLIHSWRAALTADPGTRRDTVLPSQSVNLDSEEDKLRSGIVHSFAAGGTRQVGSRTPNPDPSILRKLGKELRQLVFDPILEVAGLGCKRWLVAPDGTLNQLPFEALPLGDNEYVIDQYEVSYLVSGRDVLTFHSSDNQKAGRPMVIADPDFNLGGEGIVGFKPGMPFPPLIGTQDEAEEVCQLIGAIKSASQDALESIVKKANSPSILHISTHGFFLDDTPGIAEALKQLGMISQRMIHLSKTDNPLLRSGLALAGANAWAQGITVPDGTDDGILNGEDITGLDLLDTELVVLSACETGLGEIAVGEGVMGLRQSFILAGAESLVMSLWKVPDRQTQALMSKFYQRIVKGFSRSEALKEAQLEIKAQNPDPFYWGAFICQGNPGPLGFTVQQ
jgi:CHAT domain-containing protein/tetratricopeptide (TPR) repeat protein